MVNRQLRREVPRGPDFHSASNQPHSCSQRVVYSIFLFFSSSHLALLFKLLFDMSYPRSMLIVALNEELSIYNLKWSLAHNSLAKAVSEEELHGDPKADLRGAMLRW